MPLVFIIALFLVGCSKEEIVTCNIEVDNDLQNYTMKGIYNIYYKDKDIYGNGIDVNELRRDIGMVFQKPNPFPIWKESH